MPDYKKNSINISGFTLIEMVVSITIIIIVSGTYLVNYNGNRRMSELNMVAENIASDIRQVQGYSMGLKEYKGSFPSGGWGINFISGINGNSYTIFADVNGDGSYGGIIEDYETVKLPRGIKINKIISSSTAPSLDLVVIPPDPEISIKHHVNVDSAMIELSYNGKAPVKYVSVNSFGLVDVEKTKCGQDACVVLNSSGGLNCNAICNTYFGTGTCKGIGTDVSATNGMYLRKQGGNCQSFPGTCNATAMNYQSIICDGKYARWTYCRCSN